MSRHILDEFPDLTDEDVHILHAIIEAAEASPESPFRALFGAYDRVLAEHGIPKTTERPYFRFLLRMREGHDRNASLFQQFESLLDRLGIEVRITDEPDDADDRINEEIVEAATRTYHDPVRLSNLTRRASASSLPDLTNRDEHLSRAAQDAARMRKSSYDSLQAIDPRPTKVRFAEQQVMSPADPPRRQIPQHRVLYSPRRKSRQAATTESELPLQTLDYRYENGDPEICSNATHDPIDDDSLSLDAKDLDFATPSGYSNVGLHKLEEDMKHLKFHHVAAQCIKIFRQWEHKTRCMTRRRQELEILAGSTYSEKLLQDAFSTWRSTFAQRQAAQETQAFYRQLERRAEAARGWFLLTKAFSHWASRTDEEAALQTSARRNVMRSRCFNAWREVTAVNDFKVRRLGLRKWFEKWRNKTAAVWNHVDQADDFSRAQTASRFYKQWFWQFCDHRAPSWYDSKLRVSYFYRWLDWSRQSKRREQWADQYGEYGRARSVFGLWRTRLASSKTQHATAVRFRASRLTAAPLMDLRRLCSLAPVKKQIMQQRSQHLLRNSLLTWCDTTRLYVQACAVNDLRVQRNAWTAWNDQLRVRLLQQQINYRVLSETLCRWVIAQRLLLARRVADERLQAHVLSRWRLMTKNRLESARSALESVKAKRAVRMLQPALNKWRMRSSTMQQCHAVAATARSNHLLYHTLDMLASKFSSIQRLQLTAQDLRFYVTCKPALRQWSEAALISQRERRRVAYAAVRSRVKQRTVRMILSRWHQRAGELRAYQNAAELFTQERRRLVQAALLRKWHGLLQVSDERLIKAVDLHASQACHRILDLIKGKASAFATHRLQADLYRSQTLDSSASATLRKIGRASFAARRLEESSASLQQRNEKRHVRHILRHWHESTLQRQAVRTKDDGNSDDADDGEYQQAPKDLRTDISSYGAVAEHTPSIARTARRSLFSSSLLRARGNLPDRLSASIGPGTVNPTSTTARPNEQSFATASGSTNAGGLRTPAYLRTPSRRSIVLQSTGRIPRRAVKPPPSGIIDAFDSNAASISIDDATVPSSQASPSPIRSDVVGAAAATRPIAFTPLPSRLRHVLADPSPGSDEFPREISD